MIQYLDTLMNSLQQSLKLASENLQSQQGKQKLWHDKMARERSVSPGEKGLMLRPTKRNKLQLKWAGHFKILSKMSEIDYIIREERGWSTSGSC